MTYVSGTAANSIGIMLPAEAIQVAGTILFPNKIISLLFIRCALPSTLTIAWSAPTVWWRCWRYTPRESCTRCLINASSIGPLITSPTDNVVHKWGLNKCIGDQCSKNVQEDGDILDGRHWPLYVHGKEDCCNRRDLLALPWWNCCLVEKLSRWRSTHYIDDTG